MQTKVPLLACLIALTACGSSDTAPAKVTAVHVGVAGHVALLPVPPGAAAEDFHDLSVHVFNPSVFMANATRIQPLASATVDTDHAACTLAGCPFAATNVNIGGNFLGLVARLDDDSNSGVWAPAFTGIAGGDATRAAQKTGTDLDNNVVYALSNASLATLAQGLNTTLDDLVARGLLIGMVAGYPEEATQATHGQPPRLAGATVQATGTAASRVSVYFPNDTYTQFSPAGHTNRDGVFLVVGNSAGGTPYTISLDISDGGAHTWHTQKAGIGPSFTLITTYPAL